jgi:hypothetical protein
MSSVPRTVPPGPPPPLLRLATELHLTIISYLPNLKDAKDDHDLALLQLRRTNRYFHNLIPPPTHTDLLALEKVHCKNSRYACKFCLRLRPARASAPSMLKGKTGPNGQYRERRFCADCGFDTKVLRTSQRYSPGTRVCVGQVDWVWCNHCRLVKKGERASPCAKSVCYGMCAACYDTTGCRCGPVRGTCGKWLWDRC